MCSAGSWVLGVVEQSDVPNGQRVSFFSLSVASLLYEACASLDC